MNRGRRVMAGAAIGAMAAGAGFAWWRQARHDGAGTVDAEFWSLRLARPEGGELVMADFRRQTLLVNFWATWCAPCVRELPAIDRFVGERAPSGLRAVALAMDAPSAVREFLQRVKLTLPVGLCGMEGGDLLRLFGNDRAALPYTVLLSADGVLRQRKLGEIGAAELTNWMSGITQQ